jgi:cytochrome c oxidase assembly factor 3, fungi type
MSQLDNLVSSSYTILADCGSSTSLNSNEVADVGKLTTHNSPQISVNSPLMSYVDDFSTSNALINETSKGGDPRQRIIGGSTYYDAKTQRFGESLIRARKPYFYKNILTGFALTGLVSGICTVIRAHILSMLTTSVLYTLKAIGTDEFEDVKPAMSPPQSTESPKKS